MSDKKKQDFAQKVKAAHDAVDTYAQGYVEGDWFPRGLDNQLRDAVEALLNWGRDYPEDARS